MTKLGPPVRCVLTHAEPTYLALWGADRPSRWWALVGWVGYLRYDWRDYEVVCSGWVLAEDTIPVDDTDYSRVARVRLGTDPSEWPRPWLASDLHYAPLTRAEPALPPEGTRWDSALPHRRHKAHYELADGRSRRWPPPNYRG